MSIYFIVILSLITFTPKSKSVFGDVYHVEIFILRFKDTRKPCSYSRHFVLGYPLVEKFFCIPKVIDIKQQGCQTIGKRNVVVAVPVSTVR
jgi:hypothetical protein